MVVGACNPSYSGGGGCSEVMPLHSGLGNKSRLKKKKKERKLFHATSWINLENMILSVIKPLREKANNMQDWEHFLLDFLL